MHGVLAKQQKKNTHICSSRRSLARLFLTNKFLITQKSLLNKIHTYKNIQTKTHQNKESVASIERTIVDSHFGSSVSFQHIVDTLQHARREAWLARCLILSPPQRSSWSQGSLLRNELRKSGPQQVGYDDQSVPCSQCRSAPGCKRYKTKEISPGGEESTRPTDQKTRRPEDQKTRRPGDQKTKKHFLSFDFFTPEQIIFNPLPFRCF